MLGGIGKDIMIEMIVSTLGEDKAKETLELITKLMGKLAKDSVVIFTTDKDGNKLLITTNNKDCEFQFTKMPDKIDVSKLLTEINEEIQ